MEKRSLFNKCYGISPCLSPCTSINSKWIKDLKISGLIPETLKLMQEIARNKLEIIVTGSDFLSRTQVAL
jgi:hypothetical protein